MGFNHCKWDEHFLATLPIELRTKNYASLYHWRHIIINTFFFCFRVLATRRHIALLLSSVSFPGQRLVVDGMTCACLHAAGKIKIS